MDKVTQLEVLACALLGGLVELHGRMLQALRSGPATAMVLTGCVRTDTVTRELLDRAWHPGEVAET
jgi:hypothetical protein